MSKPFLEVCLSTELLHLHNLEKKTVVIVDIFRATSTITSAFWSGCKGIKPVATVEECFELRGNGYLLAGEQNGDKIPGFDLGNSPVALINFAFNGKKLAMVTTNGTKAIQKSLNAHQILIGSFHNLGLLSEKLIAQNQNTLILCSGWKGQPCLEDTLFAGALTFKLETSFLVHQDAALLSKDIYQTAKNDLLAYCHKASHYARLHEKGIEEDMINCLEVNLFPIIPQFDFSTQEIILS